LDFESGIEGVDAAEGFVGIGLIVRGVGGVAGAECAGGGAHDHAGIGG
jgi:hypothetical protein